MYLKPDVFPFMARRFFKPKRSEGFTKTKGHKWKNGGLHQYTAREPTQSHNYYLYHFGEQKALRILLQPSEFTVKNQTAVKLKQEYYY